MRWRGTSTRAAASSPRAERSRTSAGSASGSPGSRSSPATSRCSPTTLRPPSGSGGAAPGALGAGGEGGLHATVAAELAGAVSAQGRYEEAERLTRVTEELARPLDVAAQISWHVVRATSLAGRGELESAEALARAAVRAVEETDDLNRQGRVLVAL